MRCAVGFISYLFSKKLNSDSEKAKSDLRAADILSDYEEYAKDAWVTETPAAPVPVLKDGLVIHPMVEFHGETHFAASGAYITYNKNVVFKVNEIGRQLLSMADGKTTIDDMIRTLELDDRADDIGMFFVRLGQSGYLKNKVEITVYEYENPMEEYI
jgi:hypothetical protein